jgi:sodium transport system permease protein
MFSQTLVIARKEIVDHLREVRSIWASVMHLLMGPVIICLVMFALKDKAGAIVGSMANIFLIVSAFTGGMNVAMDLLAGERERRSLLPLLLNPVSHASVIVGKWLATTMFAACGVILTYAAFAVAGVPLATVSCIALALLPLAALAAGVQLTISTFCRTVKEAQTYLSLLIFLPMGIAMTVVFIAPHPPAWLLCVPIIGQQAMLSAVPHPPTVTPTLIVATIWCTALALRYSKSLLNRDEIVYGG